MNLHRTMAAGAATALISVALGGGAWAAQAVGLQEWWRAYQSAPKLKTGDGRGLRVFCMGAGAPAVVFEAGLGAFGSSFRDVQPDIAKTNRACVYDRAGYGGSDVAKDARDLKAISADLDLVVRAADHGRPVVLVGHSFGGPITRYYAATHRKLVAGMVLIEPSGDDQRRRFAEAAPTYAAMPGADPAAAAQECVLALEKGPIPEGSADYKACVAVAPPDAPPELKARIVDEHGVGFMRAQVAEARGLVAGGSVAQEGAAVRAPLGDIPLIVLTRGKQSAPPGLPSGERTAYIGVWQQMHWEDAQLSTHGRRRFVDGATHFLQHDRPDAAIAAVREVIGEVQSPNEARAR